MKYCGTCKQEKEVSLFGVRKASHDGLSPKCKQCCKEYDSARLRDPKRMKARRDYQKTEKGKDAHGKACKNWSDKNAVKRGCHTIIGNSLRDGRITKPSDCEECGSGKKLNGHHDDYAQALSVRWLCDDCHSLWHRENGEGKNAF